MPPATPHDVPQEHPGPDHAHHGGRPKGRVAVWWPWMLRVCWAVLPFTVGQLLGSGLSSHSRPVQVVGTALAWIGWAAGLVATLVPHPIGLTALRLIVPAVPVAAMWGAVRSAQAPAAWRIGLGLAVALVALTLAAAAETGEWAVDGPAYPNEARYPLRPPATLLPVIPLVGAATLAGAVAGPMLLAAGAGIAAVAALVVGAVVAAAGTRSLHQLSRRFVVFVPAGLVLHDPMALRDPVLFKRGLVEHIGPAADGTDALDLTVGAPGLAVQVDLHEKVEIARLSTDRRSADLGKTARFMVVPSRPGRVLAEAARRRLGTSLT